jgi:hypothetical protein
MSRGALRFLKVTFNGRAERCHGGERCITSIFLVFSFEAKANEPTVTGSQFF